MFAHFRFRSTRPERRGLRSDEFLRDLEDLRVFANYCHARKIWDKIDEIIKSGGTVTEEDVKRMQSEGYI